MPLIIFTIARPDVIGSRVKSIVSQGKFVLAKLLILHQVLQATKVTQNLIVLNVEAARFVKTVKRIKVEQLIVEPDFQVIGRSQATKTIEVIQGQQTLES